jgi:hypothetical protein
MVLSIGIAAALLGSTTGIARADDDHWRHDDRDRIQHDRWEHEHAERRYVPPPVVVAPPPRVIYQPPPVVYEPPPSGINIVLPLNFQ